MKNLRDAILAVLKSATISYDEGGNYVVDNTALWVLQEEFNIHFVEPNQPQFDAIERS